MSHMIDSTAGIDAIAYVGEKPWHGLGQELTANATVEQWRQQAGLNFSVIATPVNYQTPEGVRTTEAGGIEQITKLREMSGSNVLYRDDTFAPLSVVSNRYKVVQPAQVLDFFAEIAATSGFSIETAGALSGGRRVWALAKAGEGAKVIGRDHVSPYVLFATSYDGTMATIAKFTAMRVVCNNTIQMAIKDGVADVKISHRSEANLDAIRAEMGLVTTAFDAFITSSRQLADKRITHEQAEKVLVSLLKPSKPVIRDNKEVDVRETANYLKIMDLFKGKAIGSDISGGDNAWQLLNACTEYVDHQMGRTRDTGLTSAWFGNGAQLKLRAQELVTAV